MTAIVWAAESDMEVEMPVTLNVHGVIIEGTVVARRKYIKAVLEGMKNANLLDGEGRPFSDDKQESWSRAFGDVSPHADTLKPEEQCMYLRNVRIMNITKIVDVHNAWCVHVDSIGAWTLGHSAPK
ncbi:hypothetical protein [Sorangium sp. So ce1182]|uniref:hypothetical protein n=1 Tax=Sorangium sp. So ce1182 TaxID=3133334 RepID=UPI003F623939